MGFDGSSGDASPSSFMGWMKLPKYPRPSNQRAPEIPSRSMKRQLLSAMLAVRIGPVRLGGRLEQAVPSFWT